MGDQSWVVGATEDCDIVINEPTVSGRHCQLSQTPTGIVLTDLDSTNGTYVNGERISGSKFVDPTDAITLGTTVQLPWPSELAARDSRVIRIGRAADNDVVLDKSGISDHHAQLIVHGASITIEDLGSTNGTSVGSVDRKITKAIVNTGDTVYFGTTPVLVSTLVSIKLAGHTSASDDDSDLAPESVIGRIGAFCTANSIVVAVVGGGGLIVLVFALFIFLSRDDSDGDNHDQTANGQKPETEDTGEVQPVVSSTKAPKNTNVVASGKSDPKVGVGEPKALTPEARAAAALHLVLVGDQAGTTHYRVGSAWAIEPTTLVSSASVVMAMRDLQTDRFPHGTLFSPTSKKTLEIASTVVHPQYKEAATVFLNARQEHEKLVRPPDDTSSTELDIEKMKADRLAAMLKAFKALEKQVYFDVAIIKTRQPVPSSLNLAPRSSRLRPQLKVQTIGLAFDVVDSFFDSSEPMQPWTLDGRVGQLVSFEQSEPKALRLRIDLAQQSLETERPQLDYRYTGSPVMNDQGQVLAVYSRPTPSPKNDQPPDGRSFDAALADRIREILPTAQ